MQKPWRDWEGQVINGEYQLERYLGGADRAGVFLTEFGPRKAAIKLIPVDPTSDAATTERELSRLNAGAELSHPHLLPILKTGRAKLDDTDLLFVVMQYAEEDLAQILPSRALTVGETRDLLDPTLEALAYLRDNGFVHGRLKPANIMAVGDQLKLSSDGISRVGEARAAGGGPTEYDAPEIARGENPAAGDVWSLGVVLVKALTQRFPVWETNKEGEPVLVENLPAPFGDIVRLCLRHDPRARRSAAELAARLRQPVTPLPAVPQPKAAPPLRQAPPAPRKAVPERENQPAKRPSKIGPYVAVAAALVIVAILTVPRLFRGGSEDSQAASSSQGKPRVSARQSAPRPQKQPVAANTEASQSDEKGTSAEAERGTTPVRAVEPEGTFSASAPAPTPSREKTTRGRVTAGQVAQQVLPDVPPSARNTIRGKVAVGVRISVDSSGNVTQAELDSPGPSKYFARLALEAAQQWKFDPPRMGGRGVLSDWLLRFEFTGNGTQVVPRETAP
jgi:eukaryotic-like serine/threonine-protein kinase